MKVQGWLGGSRAVIQDGASHGPVAREVPWRVSRLSGCLRDMELMLEMRPWVCDLMSTCGTPAHRFGIGSTRMICYRRYVLSAWDVCHILTLGAMELQTLDKVHSMQDNVRGKAVPGLPEARVQCVM